MPEQTAAGSTRVAYVVMFRNVGRAGRSWSTTVNVPRVPHFLLPEAIESAVALAAKRSGHLMSRGVEAHLDGVPVVEGGGNDGTIIVGGLRPAGRFTVTRAGS